jgi:uncharacterized protein (TIGR03435 family)
MIRRMAGLVAFAAWAALAQNAAAPPAFEVASVKPTAPLAGSTGMPPRTLDDPGLVNYSSVTLKGVLCRAYDLQPDKIVGPSWLDSERYDIVARVPKDAPVGQIPLMLQNLLAEKFRMSVHWVTKQTPGYALVAGRSGPKLTKSSLKDATRSSFGFTGSGHLTWKGETLAAVATSLSVFLERPVVDMTKIQGVFDITLDAAPDTLPGLHFGTPSDDSASLPSIFAAIRGLGLSLESRQIAVKQLVVDSAQKIPTPN